MIPEVIAPVGVDASCSSDQCVGAIRGSERSAIETGLGGHVHAAGKAQA